MRIRKFRPEDLPSLLDCAGECWHVFNRDKDLTSYRLGAQRFFSELLAAKGDKLCLVIVHGSRIVGFSAGRPGRIGSWVWDLEELGIHPEYQGKWLGRKLLLRTLECVEKKSYKIWKNSGRFRHALLTTTNPIAEKLYASCGARVVERAEVAGKERVIMLFVLPEAMAPEVATAFRAIARGETFSEFHIS